MKLYKTSRELFENEWFPQANAMGVTWQEFWGMNPHIIKCLQKGYEEKIRQEDYLQHIWWGSYGLSAVSIAVEHCLAGSKAKTKFIENPIFSKVSENEEFAEEQIYKNKVKKTLLAEEQWIMASKQKGLPETII